jgi:hypothetical protein
MHAAAERAAADEQGGDQRPEQDDGKVSHR